MWIRVEPTTVMAFKRLAERIERREGLVFAWIPRGRLHSTHWDESSLSEAQTIDGFYTSTLAITVCTRSSLNARGHIAVASRQGDDTTDSDGANGDSGGAAAFVCWGHVMSGVPTQFPVPSLLLCPSGSRFRIPYRRRASHSTRHRHPGYWKNHPEAWAALPAPIR
jgi:hypothetical protein